MLDIKNRGVNNSLFELAPEGFTKKNPEAIAGVTPPYGVLGGSVAAIDPKAPAGKYVATAGDGTNQPLGLFLNNAEGEAWENAPAVASGKVTIFMRGDCEVDYYEGEITDYKIGAPLYCSADGFLTVVKPSEAASNAESNGETQAEESTSSSETPAEPNDTVIGIVTKVPTASDPMLGVKLLI